MHVKTDPDTLTDVQRAGRFFYLQKNSFGGLVVNPKFHYGVTQPSNYNLERIPEILEKTHHRLQRVQIECRPYGEILERYDRPTTCFYLDPPYWGPQLYKFNFDPAEFERLESQLATLKGKFLLSLNNRPEVRSLFGKYYIQECTIAYTAQHRPGKRYGELLIANYPLRKNSRNYREPQRSETLQSPAG